MVTSLLSNVFINFFHIVLADDFQNSVNGNNKDYPYLVLNNNAFNIFHV